MHTHQHKWFNESIVIAAFFAVIAFGLVYALFHMTTAPASPSSGGAAVLIKAPSLSEYQSETRSVLAPFLEQAAAADPQRLGAADAVFGDLINKTEERLLRVRVPAEARDTHRSFVLFLEQWRRAAGGSKLDQDRVAAMTARIASENPWLAAN